MDTPGNGRAQQTSVQETTQPRIMGNPEPQAPKESTEASSLRLRSIAPVFSTSNLTRWLNHYRALGFTVSSYNDEYGFGRLDDVEIHVSVNPDHDPATTAGCAYLRVEDSDAVHARWSRVEGGRGPAPVDTGYGMREGGHIDSDGNLLRYGSMIEDDRNKAMEEKSRSMMTSRMHGG